MKVCLYSYWTFNFDFNFKFFRIDETKAENPFLTRSVQEVYKSTRFHVDAMLGVTTAVSFLNPPFTN